MAITDYTSLKTAIRTEFARSNLDETRIEQAIRAVEIDLEQEDDFVAAFLEARATNTMTTGDAYLAMPADVINGRPFREIRITSPNTLLEYKPPHFLDAIEASSAQQKPLWYTTIGSEFRFVPTPDSDYPLEIIYYTKIPQLGGDDGSGGTYTTNELLENNPQIYLWGAIADLLPYVGGQNARRLADAPARYQRLLDKAIQAARQRRIPRGPQRARPAGTIV